MTSTTKSTQTTSRPLLHPDEVRRLDSEHCLLMGKLQPIYSRRIVYHEDWDLLHRARSDPHFPRTENVRWQALSRRLLEMRSVGRLLTEYGFDVKAGWFGRWKVKSTDGKWAHTFANDNDLWRWTYMLAMDGTGAAQALLGTAT